MTRVAAIQLCSQPDLEHNLERAGRALEEAAASGATLAVLPENFAFLGRRDRERRAIAEAPGDGPVQAWLERAAVDTGLWIVGGTVPLRTEDPDRMAAACLVLDPQGKARARYDKVHLFDVDVPGRDEGYRESASTVPGRNAVVVETPVGRLGLGVCYDLRFPELFRTLVDRGAEVLAVPSAFTRSTGREHWRLLCRARAVENQCYLLGAGQWGEHASGRETWGESLVVSPWGEVLASLAEGEGAVCADLDLAELDGLRERFPVLRHRVERYS